MKPISELKLETIELENQVLLVKNGEKPENWYLDDANQIRESVIDDPEYWEGRLGYKSIIASTKPLEGLPLLVIEDEVEDIVGENLKRIYSWESYRDHPIGRYAKEALEEHNKAKETHKFTEEDLRRAIDVARDSLHYDEECGWYSTRTEEQIIQSLTKKELWVEVENYCGSPYTTERCPKCIDSCDRAYQKLKITNNTIKGQWK